MIANNVKQKVDCVAGPLRTTRCGFCAQHVRVREPLTGVVRAPRSIPRVGGSARPTAASSAAPAHAEQMTEPAREPPETDVTPPQSHPARTTRYYRSHHATRFKLGARFALQFHGTFCNVSNGVLAHALVSRAGRSDFASICSGCRTTQWSMQLRKCGQKIGCRLKMQGYLIEQILFIRPRGL